MALSSGDKTVLILTYFQNDYEYQIDNMASISRFLKVAENTVTNWFYPPIDKKTKKPKSVNLQAKTKQRVEEAFNLRGEIWQNESEEEQFKNEISLYAKTFRPMFENEEEIKLTLFEEDKLSELKNQPKIFDFKIDDFTKNSHKFLHELAILLKKKRQYNESLDVVEYLLNRANKPNFFYVRRFRKEIMNLKAVLYSSEDINNWDKAIEILEFLFDLSDQKFINENLILIASNYKRKATIKPYTGQFKETNDLTDQDRELLYLAESNYHRAFEIYKKQKPDEVYYAGINLLYVMKLNGVLNHNSNIDIEVKEFFDENFKNWQPKNDWWELSSYAEFQMLLGDSDIAIKIFSDFFGTNPDFSKFEIAVTLRQLKWFYHFTKDTETAKVVAYLERRL